MKEYNLELNNILDEAPARFSPWKNQGIHNCTQLYKIKKSEFLPSNFELSSTNIILPMIDPKPPRAPVLLSLRTVWYVPKNFHL